jgi:hypothetical protein
VIVARIGRLHGDGTCIDLENQVEHVSQWDVATVWRMPAAPTEVQADHLWRNPPQRMVHGRDANLEPAAIFRQRHLRKRVQPPVGRERGLVELEHDACIGNRLVLRVHGVGYGENVLFVCLVIPIGQRPFQHRRPNRREEQILDGVGSRRLQVADIRLDLGVTNVLEWPPADRLAEDHAHRRRALFDLQQVTVRGATAAHSKREPAGN